MRNVFLTKFFTTVLITLFSAQPMVFGQWYGEVGLNSSEFDSYINTLSPTTNLETDFSKPYELSLELGNRFNFFKKRLQLGLGLGYEEHQINAKDRVSELAYNYQFSHLKLVSELHLRLLTIKKTSFWAHGGVNYQIPLYGAQRLFSKDNNLYIDLMDIESFSKNSLRYSYGANFRVMVNPYTDLYFKYNLNRSFDIEESNTTQGQIAGNEEFTIKSSALSIGVILKLKERKKHIQKMQDQSEKLEKLVDIENIENRLAELENEKNTYDGLQDQIASMENEIATLKKGVNLTEKVKVRSAHKSILLFGINSDDLTNVNYIKLEEIVDKLSQSPDAQLQIRGYADDKTGDPDYNKILSEKRAERVAKFLQLRGVNPANIQWEGSGGTSDFSDNSTSLNRRVEIFIK